MQVSWLKILHTKEVCDLFMLRTCQVLNKVVLKLVNLWYKRTKHHPLNLPTVIFLHWWEK